MSEHGTSLDIHGRARWLLGGVLVVASLVLLTGTWRAAQSAQQVQVFVDAEATAAAGRSLQASLIELQREMWRFEARPGSGAARRVRDSLNGCSREIAEAENRLVALQRHERVGPQVDAWKNASGESLVSRATPLASLREALGRIRSTLLPVLEDSPGDNMAQQSSAFRQAHTNVRTLTADATALSVQAAALVEAQAGLAEQAVNHISRDQLVLFLLAAFSFPLVVTIGSRWITVPLTRLEVVAKKIESGGLTQLEVTGDDEIARVTRAVRGALRRLEDNDQRQRGKIFEMRRVLRALIGPVSDAVLIVGTGGKIAYANPAAAQLLGTEVHNLETGVIDEVLFSPEFSAGLEQGWQGDVIGEGIDVRIEVDDGRVADVHVAFQPVRDRNGEVTRVIAVMRA